MSEELSIANAGGARRSRSSELFVVFRHELRALALSTRTLLPMAVYAGFGALTTWIYVMSARSVRRFAADAAGGQNLEEAAQQTLGGVLQTLGWGTMGDAAEIFRDQVPLVVVLFFVMASTFLPLLVALVSFDQLSELSTRGARFSLLRVRRDSYVLGKALASAATVSAFLLVAWAVVVGVAASRGEVAALPVAVLEGLRGWALMSVLALPYLALTALVSAFARPGGAFVATLAVWMGLSVGAKVVQYGLPESYRFLLALFPDQHAGKLLSRYAPTLWSGIGALLVLAAAGYALTVFAVRRRDV